MIVRAQVDGVKQGLGFNRPIARFLQVGPSLRNRDLPNRIADSDGARNDDFGIKTAQPKLTADGGVYEPACIGTEAFRELVTPEVGWTSYLNDGQSDLETGARRQVVFA